jgi:hypothetical protein
LRALMAWNSLPRRSYLTATSIAFKMRPSAMPPIAARNKYPFYAFRTWQGMTASTWFRILARNQFAVSPARIPFAIRLSIDSVFSSILSVIQDLIFAKRIDSSVLGKPPIFIIGHWRTGTTYLHELINLDDRFTAPTALECFAPAHCLVSEPLLRLLSLFLPSKRPMDDVLVSWDSPQEDEFALLNLGVNSPYEMLMFPNHRPLCVEFLTLTGLTHEQVEAWKVGFWKFLKCVNFRRNNDTASSAGTRQIVLKSPPHTARLHVLRQIFPQAKFIHMVRHPYEVFASTVLLWRALFETQGLQKPRFGALANGAPSIEQYVLDTMDLLYHDFVDRTAEIPANQFCQVRYEDLIRTPVAEIERVYRQLGLGEFSSVRPKLEFRFRELDGYKPNEHALPEAYKAEIRRRWRWYMERYKYQAA